MNEAAELRSELDQAVKDGNRLADALVKSREEVAQLKLQVIELQKKLDQIETAVCKECKGGGEVGLEDGEVPCPTCGGSGNPLKPGIFMPKKPGPDQVQCIDCKEIIPKSEKHTHLCDEKPKAGVEGNPWAPNKDYPGKPVENPSQPLPLCPVQVGCFGQCGKLLPCEDHPATLGQLGSILGEFGAGSAMGSEKMESDWAICGWCAGTGKEERSTVMCRRCKGAGGKRIQKQNPECICPRQEPEDHIPSCPKRGRGLEAT